jgi:hypothetical protein
LDPATTMRLAQILFPRRTSRCIGTFGERTGIIKGHGNRGFEIPPAAVSEKSGLNHADSERDKTNDCQLRKRHL